MGGVTECAGWRTGRLLMSRPIDIRRAGFFFEAGNDGKRRDNRQKAATKKKA